MSRHHKTAHQHSVILAFLEPAMGLEPMAGVLRVGCSSGVSPEKIKISEKLQYNACQLTRIVLYITFHRIRFIKEFGHFF
jgi:hypothetical protein